MCNPKPFEKVLPNCGEPHAPCTHSHLLFRHMQKYHAFYRAEFDAFFAYDFMIDYKKYDGLFKRKKDHKMLYYQNSEKAHKCELLCCCLNQQDFCLGFFFFLNLHSFLLLHQEYKYSDFAQTIYK